MLSGSGTCRQHGSKVYRALWSDTGPLERALCLQQHGSVVSMWHVRINHDLLATVRQAHGALALPGALPVCVQHRPSHVHVCVSSLYIPSLDGEYAA